MRFWEPFWTVCLLVAGAAFAFITVVVIIRGGPDLRNTLRQLRRQKNAGTSEMNQTPGNGHGIALHRLGNRS